MFERIWIVLHILAMFTAVAISMVPEMVMHRLADRGDVRAVRSFSTVYRRIGQLVPVFYAGGAVLGLLAVFFNHFDFLAPWLLIAYALLITALALDFRFQGPWAATVGAAAAQSPDDPPSAAFIAAAHDQAAKMASYGTMIIIVLIISDMVLKPF